MNTFWLSANLAGASLTTMIKSDRIDDLLSNWEKAAAKVGVADVRESSRDVVLQALTTGQHHNNRDVGEMVSQALLWLVANGTLGQRLLPLLREGGPNVKVHSEITEIGRTDSGDPIYNFRTSVDDKTGERMQALATVNAEEHPWLAVIVKRDGELA